MAGDEGELGEVVHDLVDELDPLRSERQPGPGDAGAAEDGQFQLAAHGVEGVHLGVVDRHLGVGAGREERDGPQVHLVVEPTDRADRAHHVVGVGLVGRQEAVRMVGEQLPGHRVLAAGADHGVLHAVAVHGRQQEVGALGDRPVVPGFPGFPGIPACAAGVRRVGHVLEHVLGREDHVLRLLVLEGHEVLVDPAGGRSGLGTHHRVDGGDPVGSGGEGHGPIIRSGGAFRQPAARDSGHG